MNIRIYLFDASSPAETLVGIEMINESFILEIQNTSRKSWNLCSQLRQDGYFAFFEQYNKIHCVFLPGKDYTP